MAELNNVVNLYVVREARKKEQEGSQLIWRCSCGSIAFVWYEKYGLRCLICDEWNTPRPYRGDAS
jgi:hypothetical protein